jgi:hypothetical protein
VSCLNAFIKQPYFEAQASFLIVYRPRKMQG